MAVLKKKPFRKFKTPNVEVPAGFSPSYKRPEDLRLFMTGKGKIISRTYTTLNLKMQKKLVQEIKRARHLALLPYVTVFK